VHQDKVAFLFGELPDWADPDDPDDRDALISLQFSAQQAGGGNGEDDDYSDDGTDDDGDKDSPDQLRAAFRSAVANQVANDDPPDVWATAQRLLAMGLDREMVLGELVMAMIPQFQAALDNEGPYDLDAYRAALASLPLANPADIAEALLLVVRESQPIVVEELLSRAAARLSVPVEQEPHKSMFEHLLDRAIEDGSLDYLSDDMVVEPASLFVGTVLTHRLTEAERSGAYLEAGVDLVSFEDEEALRGPGGATLEFSWRESLGFVWAGPEGWLEPFPAGAVVAAGYGEEGTSVEVLDSQPTVDPSAVATLRAAYDEAVREVGLPVSTQELLMEMVARDRRLFAAPQAPISELVEAAGLERRGDQVAHGPEIWRNAEEQERDSRVLERTESLDEAKSVLTVIGLFDQGEWPESAPLRDAMLSMKASLVAEVVADELLERGFGDDETSTERSVAVTAFAQRLLGVARKPAEVAVARWLMAMAAEHSGDPVEAEAHLQLAVEADDWPPAVERLAWYLSDKGDARAAVRLWRRLGADRASEELGNVESFATPPVANLGRNEPCWCGSGRKFKLCHLGRTGLPPLPERVAWLAWKAVSYLRHQGARVTHDMALAGSARTGGDLSEEAMERAFGDPVLLDFLLTEGGWFEQFLEERGSLLPDDEVLLATSWTLVDRTVYEVLDVQPGVGVTVKDLRDAEDTEVRARGFSNQAVPGMLICARAVPDGEGHQFVGALFNVAVGDEAALLNLLDRGDPEELAAWVGRLERPPAARDAGDEPLQASTEGRWCDEPVAALGGMTPREAAADPARREALGRLLAQFERTGAGRPQGAVAMRPARLREMLGLSPD
jgi:hypothetical protein